MRIKNSFTGVLFLAFMINVNFSCNICAAAPLLQGDFILSENYTLDADYGQLTGSLTIDGQENSFDDKTDSKGLPHQMSAGILLR